MRIVKSSVDIIIQECGADGLFKHMEKIGRIAYRSEDKSGPETTQPFLNKIKKLGHWSVFEGGTVYISVLLFLGFKIMRKIRKVSACQWSKYKIRGLHMNITTNYRVWMKARLGDDLLRKYWKDPKHDSHYLRVTTFWVCDRAIAQEVLRHRILSPTMESTRYVNYSKKLGIEFILPQWVVKEYTSIMGISPEECIAAQQIWDKCIEMGSERVISRNEFLRKSEAEYHKEIKVFGLNAQEARDVLPLELRTNLYLTGWLKDWIETNKDPESTEKVGVIALRTDKDAHPNVRVLALDLRQQIIEMYKDSKELILI